MPPQAAYGAFMIGAVGVFLLARRCLPRTGAMMLPLRQQLLLGLAAFVGGVLGAKLPFAMSSGDWLRLDSWISDGKTITTGLIGAYVAVELMKLALGIRIKTGDTFALPLALALVVGRWGCFFNGCCYGTQTNLPWGSDFGDGELRHPTQVYESLFHAAMAIVLLWLIGSGRLRSHRLQFYLIVYGIYRFLSEFIRPEPPGWLGLTFYQWVALVLIVGMAGQWAYEVWRKPKVD